MCTDSVLKMIVTRKIVTDMLLKYINIEIDLSSLINWAEDMIQESDFEDEYFELLRKEMK